MPTKCKCSAKVPDMYGVPSVHPCMRSATVERDGKWFCWQHDPERVKAEAIKRMTAWQAEQDRLGTVCARRARNESGSAAREHLRERQRRPTQRGIGLRQRSTLFFAARPR